MKDTLNKLDLMSTDNLIEELGDRFDHYIFSGIRVCDKKGNSVTRDFGGDEFMTRGLALEIIQHIEDECKVIPEEDEEEEGE